MTTQKLLLPTLLIATALCLSWACSKTQDEKAISYLALGDSYTICESVEPELRWPIQLQEQLNKSDIRVSTPKIIARTGWRTDNLLAAEKSELKKEKFDLVSLLIGVNNEFQGQSPQSFEPQFKKTLDFAIKQCKHGKNGVFVVSIPDYGYTPYGSSNQPKISKRLDAYNEICERIAKEKDVAFYNIIDISRKGLSDKNLVAKDGLHPSAKQYQLWVDRFADDVKKLVDGL